MPQPPSVPSQPDGEPAWRWVDQDGRQLLPGPDNEHSTAAILGMTEGQAT